MDGEKRQDITEISGRKFYKTERIFAAGGLCVFFLVLGHFLQCLHEGMKIAEFTVDRCETDICDLVERLETLHDHDADLTGWEFGVQGILQFSFYFIDERFHLFLGDRALIACLHDTGEELVAVEQLFCSVFLDHGDRDGIYDLISSESLLTSLAFPSAADTGIFFNGAGICYGGVGITAIRTFHTINFTRGAGDFLS